VDSDLQALLADLPHDFLHEPNSTSDPGPSRLSCGLLASWQPV
jgi:hypothetical protein